MTPFAADQTVQHVALGLTVTSGMATWLAVAADVALAIFGVSLPVVLAAATGAAAGRTLVPSQVSYRRAVFEGVLWGVVGIFTAQLGLYAVGKLTGADLPTGALSGVSLLTAMGAQIFVTQELIESLRAAIRRRIDKQ